MSRLPLLPLKLRPGTEPIRTGPTSFVVRHPQSGAVWELGADERYLLHLLQHQRTCDDVCRIYQGRFQRGLEQHRLNEFIEQLFQQDVVLQPALVPAELPVDLAPAIPAPATPTPAVPTPATPVPATQDSANTAPVRNNASALQPAAAPLPMPLSPADPKAGLNFKFDLLAVCFGWLVHPAWAAVYALAAVTAVASIVFNWYQFLDDALDWWQQFPFLLFALGIYLTSILLFNLPRMLFLGVACRRLGGRVERLGISLWESVLPIFKLDLGDTPALLGNARRWQLNWADFWFQVALWSGYILLWAMAPADSSGGKFCLMRFLPATAALFVQCNIFFDGAAYWALCGATGEWRLRERALPETKAWLLRQVAPTSLTPQERFWFRAYGLAYYAFRMLFTPAMLSLVGYWLIVSFDGVGAALFAGFVIWWFRQPLYQAYVSTLLLSGYFLGVIFGVLPMSTHRAQWSVRHSGNPWFRWSSRLLLLGLIVAAGFIPYRHEVAGECRLVPLQQRAVRTQLTDEITKIHVSEGDEVSIGQPLVTLSARQAEHDLASATAALDDARAKLDLLTQGYRSEDVKIAEQAMLVATANVKFYEAEVQRQENLFKQKATSDQSVERYRKELDKAREELVSALENFKKFKSGYRPEEIRSLQAQVRGLEEDLRYAKQALALTQITSPIHGRVVSAYMPEKQGQNAKAGTIVAVVQDDSKLLIEIAADDAAVAAVKPGMKVNVRLGGQLGELATGRVVRVAPVVDSDGRFGLDPIASDQNERYAEQNVNSRLRSSGTHVRIYAEFDNQSPELLAYMTGYARIVIEEDDVLWRAIARPVVKFIRTDVWSWLP